MAGFSYMLAPLEDMTGPAFRRYCFLHGADLTFTEMARVDALARGNRSTWSRLVLHDSTPTVLQLLGAKEQSFQKFLSLFSPERGFEGFNLNIGCPDPKIVAIGQGCAMVRRISKVRRILSMFMDNGHKISVKMRLGMNRRDVEAKSYLNLIESVDADYFIVHARHGMQHYSEPADFSVYDGCVRTGKDIIANGDIRTGETVASLKDIGVKGVMIGRAAVIDPQIFNRLKGLPSIASLEEVKKGYLDISSACHEHPRYARNLQKRIGAGKFE